MPKNQPIPLTSASQQGESSWKTVCVPRDIFSHKSRIRTEFVVLFVFKKASVLHKKKKNSFQEELAESGREESICERLDTNRWGSLAHCAVYNYILLFLARIFTIRMDENKSGIRLLKAYKRPETVDIVSKHEKANITKLNTQTDR